MTGSSCAVCPCCLQAVGILWVSAVQVSWVSPALEQRGEGTVEYDLRLLQQESLACVFWLKVISKASETVQGCEVCLVFLPAHK